MKHTKKFKEVDSELLYNHHPDSTIDLLLFLLYHISTHVPLHPFYISTQFKVSPIYMFWLYRLLPGCSGSKESTYNVGSWVRSLGWEDLLEERWRPTSVFLPLAGSKMLMIIHMTQYLNSNLRDVQLHSVTSSILTPCKESLFSPERSLKCEAVVLWVKTSHLEASMVVQDPVCPSEDRRTHMPQLRPGAAK